MAFATCRVRWGGSGDVRAVLHVLRRSSGDPPDVAQLAASANRSRRRTEAIVARLADLGVVRQSMEGDVALDDDVPDDTPFRAVDLQERRRRVDRTRIDMVRAYAEASGCRRRVLLNYFGEALDEPCGNCDRCWAGVAAVVDEPRDLPFALNDRVLHRTFGAGLVAGMEDGRITVLFEDSGYRTLDLAAVVGSALLAHEG